MPDDRNINYDPSMNVKDMVNQRQTQTGTLDNYGHGDYVPGRNGEVGGIVVDHEEVLRQETEIPQISAIKDKLNEMDQQIAYYQGQTDVHPKTEESDMTMNEEQSVLKRANPDNPETADLYKVAAAFADFEPTAKGLAPKGSQEAREYKQKMESIKNGAVPVVPQEMPTAEKIRNPEPVHQIEQSNDLVIPTDEPVGDLQHKETEKSSEPNTDIVQFNVPSDKADIFLNSMTNEEMKKVHKTTTILVNEVKTLDVPTATRTITSIDEFKRLIPKKVHSGVIETVLMNSGYVATFKGCGALAMATLIPANENESMDYSKEFNFAYENLVTTSIGKMSFNDFCVKTSVNDLSTCLLAILRASDPDENAMVLTCAECKTDYEVKYHLGQLLNTKDITDEMNEEIEKIVSVKDVFEDALKVEQESNVMTVKYAEVDMVDYKVTVEMKPTNGSTIIERFRLIPRLSNKYSRIVASLLLYIPKITMSYVPEGATEEARYDITNVDAIAEVIRDFDTETMHALGQIMNNLREFAEPTYSFKGKYVCPKCGHEDTEIPCRIEDLIFYRVGQAIR